MIVKVMASRTISLAPATTVINRQIPLYTTGAKEQKELDYYPFVDVIVFT